MTSTYNCTVCKEVFDTKMERKYHFRDGCKRLVSLTDTESAIHRVERIDGKFLCPRCPKTFTRADSLNKHWKMKDSTESIEITV